jgi:hypothetical protein
MEYNSNFNYNLKYPSFDQHYQQVNQYQNNTNMNNNTSSQNNKYYKIKETNTDFLIKNNKNNKTIKIHKILNNNNIINEDINKIYQADSIIGVFDVNENKYLGIVADSKIAAKILNIYIFKINKVSLIKMTNNIETSNDVKLKEKIEKIFLSQNFYYSNEYDLSLSLYSQYLMNSYDFDGNNNNKRKLESKFLINSQQLKFFVQNNIPQCFYSIIIFGYVGCKIDVNFDEFSNRKIDLIVIERYCKNEIIINNDIPQYYKEVEFISSFNESNDTFSFLFYVSSIKMNNINEFKPFNNTLNGEFDKYKNITCIINNYNENAILRDKLMKMNQKIKLIDFTNEWDKHLYFDTNYDSYNFISFYKNNSNNILQKNIIYFIDINNYFSENDICFNAYIRFMWKSIQKEINFFGLNIDIGLFDKNNNNYICNKFKEIIMKYHNDLDENKKKLYTNKNRDKIQFILNEYIINNSINNKTKNYNYNNKEIFNNNNSNNFKNININDNNNIYKSKTFKSNTSNNNSNNKLKLLCITWNIAGIPCNIDYNLTQLFTENIFYHKKEYPDIIVIGIQEIIKLSLTSILTIVSNQENVFAWTNNILSTIKRVFHNTEYYQLKCMDLVGIYLIILVKKSLKRNISLIDSNITKTGMYGTLGNKGFFTLTIKCFDSLISFGSGHFEAGQSKNEERIDTLMQLLNKGINLGDSYSTFKDIDLWIILGDLNFRIDLNYEDAISLIRDKNYELLYSMDQFNSSRENNELLKEYIKEKEINFEPTYKYVQGSNEYAYDEDKIRVPAWTDRIFFCKNKNIKMLTYDTIKSIRYSDHRPVVGTFLINIDNKKNSNNKSVNYMKMNSDNINEQNDLIYKGIKDKNEYKENINNDKLNDKNRIKKSEIKMNYRGINFNTEIEIDYEDKNRFNKNNYEKQNIYDFFVDKKKNIRFNLI